MADIALTLDFEKIAGEKPLRILLRLLRARSGLEFDPDTTERFIGGVSALVSRRSL